MRQEAFAVFGLVRPGAIESRQDLPFVAAIRQAQAFIK
jgi:hypothetical protein